MNFQRPAHVIAVMMMMLLSCSKKKEEGKQQPEPVSEPEMKTEAVYSYKVVSFEKNVNWSPDENSWAPVSMNMILAKESFVETGESSLLMLEGTLGDRVMLGERSKARLTIEDLSQYAGGGTGDIRGLRIMKGIAFFNIKSLLGGFLVETPTAIVKVKGTSFSVRFNEKKGTTDVDVFEGEVVIDVKRKGKGAGSKVPEMAETKSVTLTRGETVNGITRKSLPKKQTLSEDEIIKRSRPLITFPTPEEAEKTRKILNKKSKVLRGVETQAEKQRAVKELEAERKKSEKALSDERKKSQKAMSDERLKSQKAMSDEKIKTEKEFDNTRSGYEKDKQQEAQDYEKHKKASEADLNKSKAESKKAFEEERMKLKKDNSDTSGLKGGNSDDAFDEMKRRKMRK